MKIVIDAASAKMGGTVNYITNLLHEFSAAGGGGEYLVFLPPETAAKMKGLAQNIKIIPTKIGHAGMLKRVWWEQVTLRRFIKKEHADFLFSTGNFGMFWCPVRQLVLVRNTLYFSKIYRGRFLPKHSLRNRIAFELRRWLICQSAKSADVVMTPTQAMLDELRQFVKIPKAVVNHYGVSAPDLPAEDKSDQAGSSEGTGKRTFRLLYVSLYSEHKNLGTLLKALPLLHENGSIRFHLETTANPGWAGAAWTVTRQEDLRLAQQAGVADSVDFVGPLSHDETQRLYQSSDIFVFPSLTESFGFPMVEAMSHGLPIVAADTPVNREICGEGAVYFSPLSPEDLTNRLLELAADHSLCERLSLKGREEAAQRFCWKNHSRRILRIAGREGENVPEGSAIGEHGLVDAS